ncbi:MAG: CHASE2 domain-containing protein, partial [Treponemataceae bacterium]|nr:CHASE2 domain-containing protein [Treponemataceae bacterium]
MAKKKLKFVDYIDIFFVIAIVLVMGVLGSLRVFERIEYSGYDLLLHMKSKSTQDPNIMLSNIDDYALEEVGTWPWTRDIVANCLVRMREFGVDTVVFDIEYLSDSQRGVDTAELDNLPDKFNSSLENTAELFDEFSTSISRGQIPASMATSISNDLINDYLIPNYEDLYNSVAGNLVIDNDELFG